MAGRGTRITPAQALMARRMYRENNSTYREIADVLGANIKTAYRICLMSDDEFREYLDKKQRRRKRPTRNRAPRPKRPRRRIRLSRAKKMLLRAKRILTKAKKDRASARTPHGRAGNANAAARS